MAERTFNILEKKTTILTGIFFPSRKVFPTVSAKRKYLLQKKLISPFILQKVFNSSYKNKTTVITIKKEKTRVLKTKKKLESFFST